MKKYIFPTAIGLMLFIGIALFAVGARLLRPETHRVRVEQALAEYFGAAAQVGRLSLVWLGHHPGLELRRLTLRSPEGSQDAQAGFTADSVKLYVDLQALFKRQVRVRSVRLDQPTLEVVRTPQGLTTGGLQIKGGVPQDPLGWGGMAWSVDELVLRGGDLMYRDLTCDAPIEANLKSLDLKIRSPRPNQDLEFEGRAAALAGMPNATFGGTFHREPGKPGWALRLSKIRVGLGEIGVRALERAFPPIEALGLRGRLVGVLSGSIERVDHDSQRLTELTGDLKLEGAKFFVRIFKSPIDEFNADTHFDRDTVVLSSVDGQIAHGTFRGRGEVRNLNKPDPDADFEFRAEHVNLSELFPRPSAGRPQLTGRASFEVSGRVQGRTQSEWLASLQGEGRAALADGVVANVNILRMIFDKLAVSLPGASTAFAQTMPPDISQKLSVPDTLLAPTEIAFIIGNGGVLYPDFRIAGDGFEIYGSGQQGFGGDINFNTTLVLDPQISGYILYCCPDAGALADNYGRLVLPVRISGAIRNIRVEPDMNYVMRRVMAVKGPEYLMKALQGKF